MKTLRFLGMTLLMVMMAVNFTACSDDEEPLDLNSLEGTLDTYSLKRLGVMQ